MRIPSPKHSPQIIRMESTLPLHEYIYKNDVKNVKTSITENDVNVTDSKGRTALFLAASLNRYELIEVLLSSGSDINVIDPLGNTALHEAAEKGHTDIVKMLAKHDECDLDARNYDGETPLMKAAYYDYGEIARILLKEGANPDAADGSGSTALLIALRESSHVTVDCLLKHGCDVSVTDKLGHSALYIAIHSTCNKSLDLAKTLLGSGYDINQDKEWLLYEEKHNLFYQDDEFYNRLCRILTNSGVRSKHLWCSSTNEATPPSSPSLRLRKMASVTGSPPSITATTDLQPALFDRNYSHSSPVVIRKFINTTNTYPTQFSPSPHDYFTPPGSPTIKTRKTSQTSGTSSNQTEAPQSPLTRMRKMTPCPPPTENMLGSPKLSPKLRISTSLPSSPISIRRKTSQTSPLAKMDMSLSGSPLSPPCYSPLSSSPDSPIMRRKVSQTSPTGKCSVKSPLVKNDDHVTINNTNALVYQNTHTVISKDLTPSETPEDACSMIDSKTTSPSMKGVIKQRSLDSITPPRSPNLAYKRQISVKLDFKDAGETKTKQTSVQCKNSVQFNANVQVIDAPHK